MKTYTITFSQKSGSVDQVKTFAADSIYDARNTFSDLIDSELKSHNHIKLINADDAIRIHKDLFKERFGYWSCQFMPAWFHGTGWYDMTQSEPQLIKFAGLVGSNNIVQTPTGTYKLDEVAPVRIGTGAEFKDIAG
ncbi:MAG: hypothetical protein GWN62_16795 [Aliifodinibius sp.]|nr:hypothetical protein [Fodinibius sp.]